MSQKDGFLENSGAVRAHLEISQDVIQRMAANSSACKAWCVTLVSAILVLVANQGKPKFALMAFREFIFAYLAYFAVSIFLRPFAQTILHAARAFYNVLR
jgi:hypothetical protein